MGGCMGVLASAWMGGCAGCVRCMRAPMSLCAFNVVLNLVLLADLLRSCCYYYYKAHVAFTLEARPKEPTKVCIYCFYFF